jgi:hypothetical protein
MGSNDFEDLIMDIEVLVLQGQIPGLPPAGQRSAGELIIQVKTPVCGADLQPWHQFEEGIRGASFRKAYRSEHKQIS